MTIATLLFSFVLSVPIHAEPVEEGQSVGKVRVAASERYRAGRIHRFALGGGYRDLWEAPIELPILDLDSTGGGLTPTRRFGGLQTAVLGFKGADGRAYSFRGTDKDPSAVLDPLLRDTIVQVIVQDQMSAQHPGGPLAAGVLTEAAGVLTVNERMVVMPDHPALGEFREEFAGMIGTFFVYPQRAKEGREGFANATEIIDHEELYNRLSAGYETDVDVRAFLRARLMDLLIGDFDRHRKQWRWAKLPGTSEWQPIPEDRDQAFVRYDGVGQKIMKVYIPILQNYGPEYPFVKGLTLHGWEQDRWLLPSLSWAEWAQTAKEIQAALGEDVIARAVAQLPPEFAALDGERLARDIAGRRDRLGEVARRYYEYLARDVDVQLTDSAERVRIEHHADDSMTVRVFPSTGGATDSEPVFERRFIDDETDEVRVYLREGADDVAVLGGRGDVRLRLILAGDDRKRIDDSAAGSTRIYDERGSAEVIRGRRTKVRDKAYVPPAPESGFVDVEDVPPRDWGSDTIPLPDVGYEPDVGVFLGGQVTHTRYGFRKHPWSSRHTLGFGWAFEANAPKIRYRGQFRPENSKFVGEIKLQYSGIEVLRFYGFGNETNDNGSDRRFRVRNEQYRADFNLSMPLPDERFRIAAGPYVHISRTFRGVRLFDDIDPYGNHDFGVLGALVNFQFDTRKTVEGVNEGLQLGLHDNPAAGYPTSGFLVDITGQFSPPLLDVSRPYGSIRGSVAGFLSIGERDLATLAVRVGGEQTIGRTPYFDLATIGGGQFFSGTTSNRGFRSRRFQGDASVFGNVDLRVVVARLKIIVPGDVGVQAFFDAGRVFRNDETSDDWHPSGGAGIFFSPLVRTNTISMAIANSPEETIFYMRIGFHY